MLIQFLVYNAYTNVITDMCQRIIEEITHAQEELCVHASVMKISMRLLRSHNGLIDGFNGFDNNLGSGFKDTTRTNYLAIL